MASDRKTTMMTLRAIFPLILNMAAVGSLPARDGAKATTASAEAVVPLTAKEAVSATTTTAPPHFDIWADQPRLGCSLPAIRAWTVVRNVHSQPDLPRGTEFRVGPPQIIFAQRPPENPGLSKYSIIYQPARFDPGDSDTWIEIGGSFHRSFLESLFKSGQFQKVGVSSPTIIVAGKRRRISITYHLETSAGRQVDGAVLGVPAYRGMLFFTLTLEGERPQVVAAAMDELLAAVVKGLAMPTWSLTPYVVGVLLALPVLVIGIVIYRRRRRNPSHAPSH